MTDTIYFAKFVHLEVKYAFNALCDNDFSKETAKIFHLNLNKSNFLSRDIY